MNLIQKHLAANKENYKKSEVEGFLTEEGFEKLPENEQDIYGGKHWKANSNDQIITVAFMPDYYHYWLASDILRKAEKALALPQAEASKNLL